MLDEIFISIGGVVLIIVNFFKNINIDNLQPNGDVKGKNENSIFSKIIEIDRNPQKKKETKLDNIRDILLKYMQNRTIIILLLAVSLLLLLFTPLEIPAMFAVAVGMLYLFVFSYPKLKREHGYSDINQELPYALRHMGTELKSGKGLHDSMITIRNADYGSLSMEFTRVLEEVKYGKPMEESLLEMSARIKSEGLSRAIQQIVGTLRVGGNLAGSLDIIAQDITFDMQIKLKEYSQKLNSFILIYTFIAILVPVIGLIMLMAGSTVMGDVISGSLLLMIYGVFFPSLVMFMGVLIKKLEPKI